MDDDYGDATAGQWAEDPSGRHHFRWWDGTQWTGHVFDGEVPPNRPPRAVARPEAPRRRREPSHEPGHEPGADETEAELSSPRSRRQGPLAGLIAKGFCAGVVAGGIVVALIAILASVALGGGGGDAKTTTTTTKETTTSTEATTTTVGVTTTTLAPGRPPAEVRLSVQNASGVGGAATAKANALQALGYKIAGAGNLPNRQGTIVQCNVGFENDAPHLATAVGDGATVQPPNTAGTTVPSGADCVVILGTATTTTTVPT
jgi:LytR cell envelope-related transcriptional attenuator/Protein of unknown function (DUF2510)